MGKFLKRDEIRSLHEQVMYPTVMVAHAKGSGSGTLVHTYLHDEENEVWRSFVVTNHHVVDNLIELKKRYRSELKMHVEEPITGQADVGQYKYVYVSRRTGEESVKAEILAWDEEEDLALLGFEGARPQYIARLFPRDRVNELLVGYETFACGCSLAHPPVLTRGTITSLVDVIENRNFYMSSAQIIYGNSGGGMYLAEPEAGDGGEGSRVNYYFLGVPSRVSATWAGFGSINIITHMGFFIPPARLYDFFDQKCYQFIYDPAYTPEQCEELRRQKEEEAAKRRFMGQFPEEEGKKTTWPGMTHDEALAAFQAQGYAVGYSLAGSTSAGSYTDAVPGQAR